MANLGYLALLGMILGCSISDKDRCSEGRQWVAEYRGCVEVAGSAGAAAGGEAALGGTSSGTTVNTSGGGGEQSGGASAAASGGTSATSGTPTLKVNLGSPCAAEADCKGGIATFCLLNPQVPSDPGICTITNCDAAACGEPFDCCDCTKSPILASSWTETRCIPKSGVSSLTPLSCTCS